MWTYHFYSSVHWLPFMGIFVNSNTSFAKSLGMLKSTALQKSLIPFSSLSLSLPGPLGTSYILSAYQCHSGGKVGYLHSCSEAGSTLSFLTGNCLYFKKKKTVNKENPGVSLVQYFCLSPSENSFPPFTQIPLLMWTTTVLLPSPQLLPLTCGKCLHIVEPSG